jgi:hypothetical protein
MAKLKIESLFNSQGYPKNGIVIIELNVELKNKKE